MDSANRPEVLVSALERVRRRLPPTPGPRAVGGVCPSARALALAALVSESAPTIAVVPSERDAEELIAGLELVAPELAAAALPA